MAKNLTDLTERTATANTDLLHINSGGTDYKEQKINVLQGELWHIFATDSTLTSQVDALANNKTYIGGISGYGNQTATGLPTNANCYVKAAKYTGSYCYAEIWSINNPQDSHWIINKNNGTWGEWQRVPTRGEMDVALAGAAKNNGSIDGVKIITGGANFRYVRIKRESAQTSFYGIGMILQYSNNRSCIFSLGPSTPNILPLGSSTPTGTYSYSGGMNTAIIDLGGSGQGIILLGGSLGRAASTTIELLDSI